MLSADEAANVFSQKVSVDQWRNHVEQQRAQRATDTLIERNVLFVVLWTMGLLTSLGMMAFAMVNSIEWLTYISIMCLFASTRITAQFLIDENKNQVSWLTRRRYQRILTQDHCDELEATVVTTVSNDNMTVTTSIDYNGQRCQIEQLAVDSHADDALAVAGRLRARNDRLGEILTNIEALALPSTDCFEQSADQRRLQQSLQCRREQAQLFRSIVTAESPVRQLNK